MVSNARALKPDSQGFDEIRITTVPRYKTSDLSGDEWRISTRIEFLRNGEIKFVDEGLSCVETTVHMLSSVWFRALDEARGYFAGEGDFCDQEGCADTATVFYKKKKDYCREGHESEPIHDSTRAFCARHARRGDCGLDDADRNYEPLG